MDAMGEPWTVRGPGPGSVGDAPGSGALRSFSSSSAGTAMTRRVPEGERWWNGWWWPVGWNEISEEQLQGFLDDALPPAS